MADAVIPPSFQLEYLAFLPNGVGFPQGMTDFCQQFSLTIEASETDRIWASSDDFSVIAKLMNSQSTAACLTVFMVVETEDKYSLLNAREMIEERSSPSFIETILLRDSVGEERTRRAYQLLNELENALRKLVAVRSASLSGQDWWNVRIQKCLHPDKGGRFKYQEYRDREVYDADITPSKLPDHHDLFYLDLSELKRAIEDADNWREGFAGDLKVLKNIERLDMFNRLRRKIAHNRFLSNHNLEELNQLHEQLMHLCHRTFQM